MTTAAQANTANTLLAIARLNQTGQELRSRQQLRQDVQAIKEQQLQEMDLKQRQAQYQSGAEAVFGEKFTPEMAGYTEPTRAMFQKGATTDAPIGSYTVDPTTGESTTARSPMGFPLVQGVRRQPTPSDIQSSFRQGGMAATEDSLKTLEAAGVKEKEPQAYALIQGRAQPTLPSQALKTVEELGKIRKAREEERQTTGLATQAESKARTDVATEGMRVAEAASAAKLKAGEADKATALAKIEEARAEYAVPLAVAEASTRQAEAGIKIAELGRQPTLTQQAEETLRHTRLQNQKLNDEITQTGRIRAQIDYIRSLKPDDPKLAQAYRDLAVVSNQPGVVLSDMHAVNAAWVNSVEKGVAANVEARKLMAAYEQDGKPETLASAQSMAQAGNQIRVNAAKMMNQPTTEITTIIPGGKGMTGSSGSTLSRTMVRTENAELFTNGTLDKIARMDPAAMQQHPNWSPGQALAETIRIRHSGYAGDDSTVYADAIKNATAPAAAKEEALRYLQQASASVKPITTEEAPPVKGAGAPGLSLGGTTKGAGTLIGKGLGKLAPYNPMLLSQ